MNFDDLQIDNGASQGGGGFFKPAEFGEAVLIIFEPKDSRPGRFANADGSPKFEAIGDFTVFMTENELAQKEPGTIMEDAICSSGVLAKILIERQGGIVVGTVEKTEPKQPGRQGYWAVRSVDPKLIPAVKEYLKDREEKRQEDLPDWAK